LHDALAIIAVAFELPANPPRNLRTTHVAEAGELGIVGDRHDAWYHRDIDALFLALVDEAEIGVDIVEILGDGAVGATLDFLLEEIEVLTGRWRLRMKLRVGRDFDQKMLAAMLADMANQIAGIAEGSGGAHTRRQIATQGDDTLNAFILV